MELLRLIPAFNGHATVFATVDAGYITDVPGFRFCVIPDATRWNKLRLVWSLICIFALLLRERPDVVITTGAAPGYLAIRCAKLLRMRTIWLDSLANAEELSLSGQQAGRHVDLWLTQWAHLAVPEGPQYAGAVL